MSCRTATFLRYVFSSIVKAASVAGVAVEVGLFAATREVLSSLLRELIYRAVPADDRITSRTAAAASAYARQNRAEIPACVATAILSRSMAERMLDQASAGGSIDFGRSAARASIAFRLSTSAAQISHPAI